jgi:hypothetical protein
MPASVSAIAIDGVLADQQGEDSFAASRVVSSGALIYRALTKDTRVVLVSRQDPQDISKVLHWLKAHGFEGHFRLVFDSSDSDPERGLEDLVQDLRRSGSIALAVESDPHRGSLWLRQGVPTVVISVPYYRRPEHTPGFRSQATPWDEMVIELDRQAGLVENDDRVTTDVVGSRFDEG